MKKIRIGTRDSKLALWQAQKVASLLTENHIETEIVKVKTEGDKDLVTPLYAMGVQGIFTKTLDAHLLSQKVDIVVHSMKDVPVQLAQGIAQAAVLPRANYHDLLVFKEKKFAAHFVESDTDKILQGTIATGSVRRKATLLHHFPKLNIVNLRGNVQTRMQKLQENDWDAAIFAAAGLERIQERPSNAIEIKWMLPAPAQGTIMVVCRTEDKDISQICENINDAATAMCVKEERNFLATLLGGCSTPISALAQIINNEMIFKGEIYALDGKEKFRVEKQVVLSKADNLGVVSAEGILQQGAHKLVQSMKKNT